MSSLKTIAERISISHRAYVYASSRLDQAFEIAKGGGEPDSIAIIGPSRAGKTTVLQNFCDNHDRKVELERSYVPVILVPTPPLPSAKGLAGIMLDALGHPDPWRGTELELTSRLKRCLAGTGTKMLVFDEFQHFYDRGRRTVMNYVADWLKVLINDTGITLVVSGLEQCLAVIDQNEQLAGRLSSPIRLDRFRWDRPQDRDEFISVLDAYQDEFKAHHYDLPQLDFERVAYRFWLATGGLIGYLSRLFRQAERNAMRDERRVITLDHFHVAHEESVWAALRDPEAPRPFADTFLDRETTDLNQKAVRIGEPIETPATPSRCGPRRAVPVSLNSVLVAKG